MAAVAVVAEAAQLRTISREAPVAAPLVLALAQPHRSLLRLAAYQLILQVLGIAASAAAAASSGPATKTATGPGWVHGAGVVEPVEETPARGSRAQRPYTAVAAVEPVVATIPAVAAEDRAVLAGQRASSVPSTVEAALVEL